MDKKTFGLGIIIFILALVFITSQLINKNKPDETPPIIHSVTGNPNELVDNVTLTVEAADNKGITGYSFDGGLN
jgi:regulatory protein YycI of two-component signal transduction system YycFG